MIVTYWKDIISGRFVPERSTSVTIGVFDGVHRGHRLLLDLVVARKATLMPTAVTFRSNPKAFRGTKSYEGDILSLDQKLEVFDSIGVELVVLIDFSEKFGKLTGKEFIGLLKDRGRLRYLAVGSDFRCGYRLDTDAVALRSMNEVDGIVTDVVPPVAAGNAPVSSSRIRSAIIAGNLVEASFFLGRNVEIDLTGVPTTPGRNGLVAFDARAVRRLTPPDGRYPVILIDRIHSKKTERFVDIANGVIFFPSTPGVTRVEFLPVVAQGE